MKEITDKLKDVFDTEIVAWSKVKSQLEFWGFESGDINEFQKAGGYGFKISRGKYCFSGTPTAFVAPVTEKKRTVRSPQKSIIVAEKTIAADPLKAVNNEISMITGISEEVSFVPVKIPSFVSFGIAADLKKILRSKMFLPVYVTGETGYGKTMIIEQSAAIMKREVIRINCTKLTDEDELIGHFLLRDGDMIWKNGPVLTAMERGAILLIDEIDHLSPAGSSALFSVLEGSGVFVKKLNRRFTPEEGFTVVATANTKGRGSVSGKYIGTNVQNAAFLDRFVVTLEHKYPTQGAERKILAFVLGEHPDMIKDLCDWSSCIRQARKAGASEEEVSTRSLVNIAKLVTVFGDVEKSIGMAIAKYEDNTKETFIDFFKKIRNGELVIPVDEQEEDDA